MKVPAALLYNAPTVLPTDMLSEAVERLSGQNIPTADEIISLAAPNTPYESLCDEHQEDLKVNDYIAHQAITFAP
jgi:hypothetical protein